MEYDSDFSSMIKSQKRDFLTFLSNYFSDAPALFAIFVKNILIFRQTCQPEQVSASAHVCIQTEGLYCLNMIN